MQWPPQEPGQVRSRRASSRNLFVRNATGLVRELSAFDAFNLVFSAVLIPVGITEVMAFTPTFWPHANMLVSFLLATPWWRPAAWSTCTSR